MRSQCQNRNKGATMSGQTQVSRLDQYRQSERVNSFGLRGANRARSKSRRGTGLPRDLRSMSLVQELPDVYRHSLRVAASTRAIGVALGLSWNEIARMGRAAEWHDIGKLLVPRHILYKRGPLTPMEYRAIMQHTVLGERLLQEDFGDDAVVMGVVRLHHEYVDGAGLNGMTARDIPLAAQMVSVADAFDALTHRRPYRAPTSTRVALRELEENAGSQFDCDVVEAMALVARGGRVLSKKMAAIPAMFDLVACPLSA